MAVKDITEDAILGGRVRLRQPARGYRVNVDTLLLAAALPVGEFTDGARLVELGCGVGGALLSVAAMAPEPTRLVGIEREPTYAALAKENVALNGAEGRVEVIAADALDPQLDLGRFDHVFFNPPYDREGEGRPPGAGKRAAFLAERPLEDWIKLWSNRLRGDASLTLIHRAHRLTEILAALEGRLGGVVVYPVRASAGSPASRVIVRARKGSRAPLLLLGGLDLHSEAAPGAKYTAEADAILRGEARIRLG